MLDHFSKKLFLLSAAFSLQISELNAQDRSDAHAPIGVMRDHVHNKGEFMTSYRFKNMAMKDLSVKDSKITTDETLDSYMSAPTKMQMKMHMLGAMYGITDNFTIAAMGSFVEKDMDHKHRMNGEFNRTSQGIGDTKINAMYQFFKEDSQRSQLNFGISLPTGDFNEKHNGTRLPYPMQIGSGSYELLPGLHYSAYHDSYSFGGQVNAVFRLNSNNVGYRLGDSYNATSWVSHSFNPSFSVSSRLDYNKSESIQGIDPSLNPAMVPTADNNLHGRETLDLLLGFNFLSHTYFRGHRLAFEVGVPIYQRLDGPALENSYVFTIGWQKIF